MTVRALVLLVVMTGGCALLDPRASRVLADADFHAVHGDYPAAMAAYNTYLARYPANGDADRVRAARTLLSELMTVRAERDRLVARAAELSQQLRAREAERDARDAERGAREADLIRRLEQREADMIRESAAREAELRAQATARDAEIARLRQDLNARQAEIARLREDLEALKRTDLQMERRRR